MGKFIALILVVVIVIGGVIGSFTLFGIGNGNGSGSGSENSTSTSKNTSDKSDSPEENHVSEIRIDKDKIYFDNELCSDENELKQKMTDIGTKQEYIFTQNHAIKGTYDKVNDILIELENALDITVNRE